MGLKRHVRKQITKNGRVASFSIDGSELALDPAVTEDDFLALLSALAVSGVLCLLLICAFSCLRRSYPSIYANNVKIRVAPSRPGDWFLSWAWTGWTTEVEQAADAVGLDSALIIEFCDVCMKMLLFILIPLYGIEFYAAHLHEGTFAGRDFMSSLSFQVDDPTKQLIWAHVAMIWSVVFIVERCIFSAQTRFIELRFRWLRRLPDLRSRTILVEGIPKSWSERSDRKLQEYFVQMFSKEAVVSASVVQDTSALLNYIAERDKAELSLAEHDNEAIFNDLREELERKNRDVEVERKKGSRRRMYSGFVTFRTKKDAQIALTLAYRTNRSEMICSVPPEAQDIVWADLMAPPDEHGTREFIGYSLIVILYLAFCPLVLGIMNVTQAIDIGAPAQPVWQGLGSPIGLMVLMSYGPQTLEPILRTFFVQRSFSASQVKLQVCLFWFLMFFIVIVAVIGNFMVEFTDDFFRNPFATIGLLADAMPEAASFFMNFFILQWASRFYALIRYGPLSRFMALRRSKEFEHDVEGARSMAEPEDQGSSGIGARCARMTVSVIIAVIYSSLCPGVAVVALVNFLICRVVYGYIVPFAETRKPDLGGVFWVQQFQHLYVGVGIYCVLMSGVLYGRSEQDIGPATCACPSVFYVVLSYRRFTSGKKWESLPFKELVAAQGNSGAGLLLTSKEDRSLEYTQPELSAPPPRKSTRPGGGARAG